jgi:hypothetical protein
MRLKMENGEKGDFKTSDLYLASAISLLIEVLPEYKVDENGRVFFCFSKSPELYEAIASYGYGVQVNAYEFTLRLKRVRGEMLRRKNELAEQGKQRTRSDGRGA